MLGFSRQGTAGGPLVVFLHGAAIDSWMWTPVLALLRDIEVLLIDLPGHGKSRASPWTSLDEVADEVGRLIEVQAEGRAAHLVAISLGSYVAITLMAQQPQRYTSAVLSGLHAGNMPNRLMMKTLSLLMAPLVTRRFFARANGRQLLGPDADLEGFVAESIKTRPRAFRRATDDVVDFVAPANLESIGTRTLVVAGGKEDPLILS